MRAVQGTSGVMDSGGESVAHRGVQEGQGLSGEEWQAGKVRRSRVDMNARACLHTMHCLSAWLSIQPVAAFFTEFMGEVRPATPSESHCGANRYRPTRGCLIRADMVCVRPLKNVP